jgi:predicted MFS family arabinose efflux permease
MTQVRTAPYGRVLRVPGTRPLYGLALVSRIPVTAAPTALTLRVVLGMHKGFAESGLVAAAVALGMACGAPLLGRLVDRRGARTVLILTTLAQALFWGLAGRLAYTGLVPAAFVAGALSLPVFSLTRQAIAALLPASDRQAGMSLDSMSVEISYSIGPALGVVAVTRLGSSAAMLIIGAAVVVAGIGLILFDPPTAPIDDPLETSGPRTATSTTTATTGSGGWLTPLAVAALVATSGATLTLSGTDIALTASMRAFGHVGLLGLVVATWCLASLAGGFVYGTMPRRRDPLLLLVLLAALTVIMVLAGSWWALLLLSIPSGLFCAPLMSSTVEVIAGSVPPAMRGRALGVHTSALTLGSAAGAPLTGWAIDQTSPSTGFVAIGALGTILALGALAVRRHRSSRRPSGRVRVDSQGVISEGVMSHGVTSHGVTSEV